MSSYMSLKVNILQEVCNQIWTENKGRIAKLHCISKGQLMSYLVYKRLICVTCN